ncbi:hypothetical protein GCM10014719_06070 [Planomonospora parontospora subsp. antibiotica]|nr:hypothetical protein GCM10014719_06070 [Planomonospora parontospora subsp. antibiotica]GII14177.1 hypothetical protein Ppa05_09030 [Planomonospora parontospora subsp. antibiotica]
MPVDPPFFASAVAAPRVAVRAPESLAGCASRVRSRRESLAGCASPVRFQESPRGPGGDDFPLLLLD